MSLLLFVIVTTVVLAVPATVFACWLVGLGRKVAGAVGMRVAAFFAVLVAAVPLTWAASEYWRLWMAGISLHPQYGDQYLGYALLVAFVCVPILVIASLRWFCGRGRRQID
jgi:Na+-translocating ferredoxin:NAD+ oxidoreductase RnfA subunit